VAERDWQELLSQIQWARDRDVATHLDGARIWGIRALLRPRTLRLARCSTHRLFHVHLSGHLETLEERALDVAEERRLAVSPPRARLPEIS
jgi:hypothetical protein